LDNLPYGLVGENHGQGMGWDYIPIQDSRTLTIEPGVEIFVAYSGTELQVHGRLVANGATFTNVPIWFESPSGSGSLTGCTFTSQRVFDIRLDTDLSLTTVSGNTYPANAYIGIGGGLWSYNRSLPVLDNLPYGLVGENHGQGMGWDYIPIQDGRTLTIEPGVEIFVAYSGTELQVHGCLVANGATFTNVPIEVYSTGIIELSNNAISGSLNFNLVSFSEQILYGNTFGTSFHLTVSGDANAILNAEDNWWGTNEPNQIEAEITHHFDDPARPWVDYEPFLISPPSGFFAIKRNLLIENTYPTQDGFFTDAYFASSVNRCPLNTQDPLRYDLPFNNNFNDSQNYLFGNAIETQLGWRDFNELELFTGRKEKGQWSRLGQVINPSLGFLIEEVDFGSQEWRWRQLVTDSNAVIEYHSNDANKAQEDFTVSLVSAWRCLGLAKSDLTAWYINSFQDLVDIVSGGLEEVISTQTEITTVLFFWNIGADKLDLYGVGVNYLPEDSSLKAWTYLNVVFEKQDGTHIGSIGPVFGGWPDADPLKNGLYDSGGQISRSEPRTITLPVDEPITVKMQLLTRAEAKGAAESYAGILGYELRIDGPSGTNPLIFSGTDPCPNDLDLPKGFGSSLLQAAETIPFGVGAVHVEESFGDSNSLNDTGVVILPIDTNSPVSGIFVPVYLVPQMRTIHAHIDAFWTDGSDLSNTCVEFMLVDDANNLRINGGLASQLFGNGEPIEPIDGLNRHSGDYDLILDISHLRSGNYVLAVIYGEPNYSEPNSCLIIKGLSAYIDPNIRTSIAGDFTFDGKVDLADLKELSEIWLSPTPISEKDLYPDGIINFMDFAVLVNNWLKTTVPADLDIDGDVDFGDFALLANQWLGDCNAPDWCSGCDFDRIGSVDVLDLAEFAQHCLECI
jgi:hypothetical protein